MTNGAMNVEIGNPAYKIYEGEPDDDAGELLDADFNLDPDKVHSVRGLSGSLTARLSWTAKKSQEKKGHHLGAFYISKILH